LLSNYNSIKKTMFIFFFAKLPNNKLRVFAAAFQAKLKCLLCLGLHASGLLSKKTHRSGILLSLLPVLSPGYFFYLR
jgi:hypothetical protein